MVTIPNLNFTGQQLKDALDGLAAKSRSSERLNVRDFGVLCDGSDESTKMQAALDACAAVGGTLELAHDTVIAAGLLIDSGIEIVGGGPASLLQSSMVVSLELRNRGLVKRGRHERGGLSLWAGRAPAALIEPYFGSNSKDCAAADMIHLARAIDRAATEFLAREARDV